MSGEMSVAGRRLDHREDRLAERARLRELGEAPFRGEPVRRLDDDDGLGLLDLAVKRPLPVARRAGCRSSCPCRETRSRTPGSRAKPSSGGRVVVAARMRDEDSRHAAFPVPTPMRRCGSTPDMWSTKNRKLLQNDNTSQKASESLSSFCKGAASDSGLPRSKPPSFHTTMEGHSRRAANTAKLRSARLLGTGDLAVD